uniref:Uncharacterized protein n=1 Tax=Romanomermis culicivorax TaxID=13658 RepID=A0A915JY61_ROMCU
MTTLRDFQIALQKSVVDLEQKDQFINDLLDELSEKTQQIRYLHLKLARCVELMRNMRLHNQKHQRSSSASNFAQNSTKGDNAAPHHNSPREVEPSKRKMSIDSNMLTTAEDMIIKLKTDTNNSSIHIQETKKGVDDSTFLRSNSRLDTLQLKETKKLREEDYYGISSGDFSICPVQHILLKYESDLHSLWMAEDAFVYHNLIQKCYQMPQSWSYKFNIRYTLLAWTPAILQTVKKSAMIEDTLFHIKEYSHVSESQMSDSQVSDS